MHETEKAIIRAAYAVAENQTHNTLQNLHTAVRVHKALIASAPARVMDCDGHVWVQRPNELWSIFSPEGLKPYAEIEAAYGPLRAIIHA